MKNALLKGEHLLKMDSIDRISNLPDSLLHCIMSCLESQEAVQTCVLSKRWENLWASLQFLYLDRSKFETTSGDIRDIDEKFMKFVNTLLLLRDSSDLEKFHLKCCEDNADVCHWTIMAWILYAIKRNAKVIEINVPDFEELPQCMFNCESLEELNLCISSIDKGIKSRGINLPRLKKLVLCVHSDDTDILQKLALGCPALEDLYLNDCNFDMRVVSFPKLKYLNIRSEVAHMCVEFISAPNLVSLALDGCARFLGETTPEKMPSLMHATISLTTCDRFDAAKCNLLRAVANVQNLELSGSTILILFAIKLPACPTFFNLTTLLLRKFCIVCHSNEVGDILRHTPNLKKLTLCGNINERNKCDEGSSSIESALLQCKNLDEIEVELKCINLGTFQLVNILVKSLVELKATHPKLSLCCFWSTSSFPTPTDLHPLLCMVPVKHVLTSFSGNKFIVRSK